MDVGDPSNFERILEIFENDHDNLQLFVRENLKKNLAKSINLEV